MTKRFSHKTLCPDEHNQLLECSSHCSLFSLFFFPPCLPFVLISLSLFPIAPCVNLIVTFLVCLSYLDVVHTPVVLSLFPPVPSYLAIFSLLFLPLSIHLCTFLCSCFSLHVSLCFFIVSLEYEPPLFWINLIFLLCLNYFFVCLPE